MCRCAAPPEKLQLQYHFGSLSYWVCPSIWPSVTEIGEMACITPAWSSGGHALKHLKMSVTSNCWKLCFTSSIDHFHKWRSIINSFESIKIRLTNLILKLVIQKNFDFETRLVRLIFKLKMHTKEF